MVFTVHSRLAHDSVFIADLPLSQCRLMNNAQVTWLLLIPRVANVSELIDLSMKEQESLLTEIRHVSHVLQATVPCDKLNIASLGNVVSQLHMHVIARRHDDAYWPNPVWGGVVEPYVPEALDALVLLLKEKL